MMNRVILAAFFIFPLVIFTAQTKSLDGGNKIPAVKKINEEVTDLEKKIAAQDKSLPTLKVQYDYHDATEGIPPTFDFYYDQRGSSSAETSVLRVSKTHVGKEVFSVDHIYYFDSQGRPMKYLVTNSGVTGEGGFPASRDAIFYDPSGKVIWQSSTELTPPLSFKKILDLFRSLDNSLSKF
jgi:hypothetical protein